MQQVMEFAANHPLLVGGFVVVLLALVASELARRMQKFRELGPAAAVQMMNRDESLVLDVSSQADFNRGHILGAKHLPLSQVGARPADIEKWRQRPILVVCKNGQSAPQAAGKLAKLGCTDVSVLAGGMARWSADNYPVSKD